MKQQFSVWDAKCKVFSTPLFALTIEDGQRIFQTTVNDPDSLMCLYPADYTLFHSGTFDEQTGISTQLKAMTNLGLATQYVNTQSNPPSPVMREEAENAERSEVVPIRGGE